MGRQILFVLLAAILSTQAAWAAHWEHEKSVCWTQTNSRAETTGEQDPTGGGWHVHAHSGQTGCASSSTSTVSAAEATANTIGAATVTAETVTLDFNTAVTAQSDDADSTAEASAVATVVHPTVIAGIYYRLVSDGEPADATFRVRFDWQASLTVTGNGRATVEGGFSPDNDIFVTVNDTDGEPGSGTTVYTHARIDRTTPGTLLTGDGDRFTARVGDVIGIFFGASCDTALQGAAGSTAATADTSCTLTLEVPHADIDNSGDVDPVDLSAMAADFLAASSPADLNQSGRVDLHDLAILGAWWYWLAPPPLDYDLCRYARPAVVDTNYTGSTVGKADSDVWYSFTAPAGAIYDVSLCGSDYDTYLAIHDDCDTAELAQNNDSAECPASQSQLLLTADQDATYFIRIAGHGGDTGNYDLLITETVPDNDECEFAQPAVLDTHYTGTLVGKTNNDVWYSFTPTVTDFYEINACPSMSWIRPTVWDHCGFMGPPVAEPVMDDCVTFAGLQADTTYYIQVQGYEGPGEYDLVITQGVDPPGNDECTSAYDAYPYEPNPGATLGATGTDVSTCGVGDSYDVWYRYNPEMPGPHNLIVYNEFGSFDGTLAVYDSCTDPVNAELQCAIIAEGGDLTLFLGTGTTYYIRVADYTGTSSFMLELFPEEPH